MSLWEGPQNHWRDNVFGTDTPKLRRKNNTFVLLLLLFRLVQVCLFPVQMWPYSSLPHVAAITGRQKCSKRMKPDSEPRINTYKYCPCLLWWGQCGLQSGHISTPPYQMAEILLYWISCDYTCLHSCETLTLYIYTWSSVFSLARHFWVHSLEMC